MLNFLRLITFLAIAVLSSLPASEEFLKGIENAQFHETCQGNVLRYTHFESPVKGKKIHALFVQGRGTFLEFYETAIDRLLEKGIDVWMFDLTGQGGSTRLPLAVPTNELTAQRMQHIQSFERYITDLDDFVQTILLPQTNGDPLLLVGYSTGAHIALRYLEQHPENPFKGMFAISPLLSLQLPIPINHAAILQALNGLSRITDLNVYVRGAGDTDPIFEMPFVTNPYTSDEQGFDELRQLCVDHTHWMMGGISYSWLKAAIESVLILWDDAAIQKIQIPVLICTGGEDGVVNVDYNNKFAKALPFGKNLFYPTGRHELFRETPSIRDDLWHQFDDFCAPYFK